MNPTLSFPANPNPLATSLESNLGVGNLLNTINNAGSAPQTKAAPTTTGSGSGGFNPSVLNDLYDQQVNYLQNYANNAVPQYQNLDTNIINQGYDTQRSGLDAQHQLGQANLDQSQNVLDTQKTTSLRNLGDQLRGQFNSYRNQLGVMGAGDSSAAPLVSYALQQQGNTATNDLNQQYAQQQTGLNLQRQGLDSGYQTQIKALDNWKNTNLQQIAENYAKQLDQLHQQIMNAQGDKARFLSLYGSQQLADQALAQMKALNQQYTNQVDGIHQTYQGIQAPNADISNLTQGYNVQPFSQQQLQGLNLPNNQAQFSPTANIPVNLQKRPDQNLAGATL